MSWVSNFLTSSIGKKLIMSLTGLFLILFLTVHLIGNLQLLFDDGGKAFNIYADMMGHNPIIQIISIGNFFFILLHSIQGIMLWRKNRAARGAGYAVNKTRAVGTSAAASKRMGWLGTIILVFILIHLYQFWLKMKLGNTEMIPYDGVEVKNLYKLVSFTFSNIGFSIFYILSMTVIGIHLWHGFQSAFQTLGLNHQKYTPFIKGLGKVYSVLIPLGFALIPICYMLGIRLF